MSAQLLRIGDSTINLATVTQILDDPMSNVICVYFNGPSEGSYQTLHGEERAALLAWLEKNSVDVMQYNPIPWDKR